MRLGDGFPDPGETPILMARVGGRLPAPGESFFWLPAIAFSIWLGLIFYRCAEEFPNARAWSAAAAVGGGLVSVLADARRWPTEAWFGAMLAWGVGLFVLMMVATVVAHHRRRKRNKRRDNND